MLTNKTLRLMGVKKSNRVKYQSSRVKGQLGQNAKDMGKAISSGNSLSKEDFTYAADQFTKIYNAIGVTKSAYTAMWKEGLLLENAEGYRLSKDIADAIDHLDEVAGELKSFLGDVKSNIK